MNWKPGDPIPEGMEVVTLPSVLPVYAAAAVWLVWGLFLPMLSWGSLLLAAAVSLLAALLTQRFAPKRTALREKPLAAVHTGAPEADEVLRQGRAALRELRTLDAAIADEELSAHMVKLSQVAGAMFAQVEAHPDQAKQLRRFMNYYLPTTLDLLRRYAQLSRSGVESETIRQAKQSIEQVMDKILAGFEQQYDDLFQDEALDLSAEIEVLETMLGRDGLNGSDH